MENIRIKDDRMRKRQREHIHVQYNNLTPPKYRYKQSKFNLIPKYKKQMGYDYKIIGEKGTYHTSDKIQPTREMKWQKQQFQYAIDKLLGKHIITKKMTGKDKWKLKQELGISINSNKMKQMKVVDKIINKQLLLVGLQTLIQNNK